MDKLEEANKIYLENFDGKVWFGRCIFLSWYCKVGSCKFCFRSTVKDRIKHAKHARRSKESVIVEAILAKKLGWRIEFLTGGYGIFPFEELVDIAKMVKETYEDKIWLNLGTLSKEELEKFRPYVEGITASIETPDRDLHHKICPDKKFEDYEKMLMNAKDFKKSITIVIGLGEKEEDKEKLFELIEKYKLDRITFYALKPIKGTPYKKGPESKYYASWIADTRIRFPKLEIIAGTTVRRVKEVGLLLKAGANAITKFPATKKFNSVEANILEDEVYNAGRKFVSTLTKLPEIDVNKEVNKLNVSDDLKEKVKILLKSYLNGMDKSKI